MNGQRTDRWQEVIELQFEGPPYDLGGLDRAALIELANLQTFITLYAASLWRVDHAGDDAANDLANQPPLPGDFVDQATLRVNAVDPAESSAIIARRADCGQVGKYIDQAAANIMRTLQAAERDSSYLEQISHRWLTNVKAIGAVVSATVDQNLTLRATSPCCGSAAITRASRLSIVREMYRRLDQQEAALKRERPRRSPPLEQAQVPPDENIDDLPDGSIQVDAYAYGVPKQPVEA